MFREFIPRWFIATLIMIFIINLGAIYSRPPQHDPNFVHMVKLLKWRDPITDQQLILPIDRSAPLPEQIIALQELKMLDLSAWLNRITEIPPEVGYLPNLQRFDARSNGLTQIPPELGQLSNLEQLNLEDNNLTELPLELSKLTKLKQLNLYGNELGELPPEITNLPDVTITQ